MLFLFECPTCGARIEADASVSGRQAHCPQCQGMVAVPASCVDCGATLGGFRLDRRLGKGGMGEVFLAQQLSVERQVAVKILPPGFAENPDAVRRFLHEGKLAARLDHHNIVTVFEAGEDSGNYYLAMAFIEGESLDQRLKRDKVLPEAEVLAIVRSIADALAYAWETFQLLHRDLKPANIMVDNRQRVFLMDLGLAKSLGEESGMTLSGSILGTPQYMSPEQAQGLADLGVPTDVYALGATLYHLVTGSPPFTGDTTLKVLHKHMFEPLPPPRSRNPNVSAACSRLIETMMAKEPAGRYGDWRALIADIDRVLQGQEPAARRPEAGASMVMPSSAVSRADLSRRAQEVVARQHQAQAPTPAVVPAASPATKRLPWSAIGIAAAVLVVLTLGGVLVASRRGPAPAPGNQAVAGKPPAPAAGGPAQPLQVTTPEVTQAATPAKPDPAPARPAPTPSAAPPPTPTPPAAMPPPAAPTTPAEPVAAAPQPAAEPPKAAATPAEPAAPAPAPAVAPAPAQARLTALLEQVATALAAGQPGEALQRWQAGCAALELQPLADQVAAIGKTLGEAAGIPQRVSDSFKADVGKTVEIELAKEKVTCEVREVSAAGIKVIQTVKRGQGRAKLARTIAPGELSLPERLRRLGTGDTPALSLQRGLLALEAGRPDTARKLFAKAGGPLGEALVARIEAQQAEGNDAAGERALSELLRQISGSPELATPAKVTASIRKRCGDNPKRYEEGRRLLARFEKEWGRREPGKTWVPVLQEALAYPPRQGWTVPDLGLNLVWVAPGSFQMGSADTAPPVHEVQISRGFWMGKYEVTQAEYEALMGRNPSGFKGARNPVETVSWGEAGAFCTKLTERERAAGRIPEGYEYRLPTEAEWESAARGGPASRGFEYAGSDSLDEVAWYDGNSGGITHPVGQKRANELGLYDMSGNVFEWCQDWYGQYPSGAVTNPAGPEKGLNRVIRGGSWSYGAVRCRAADRLDCVPSYRSNFFGFRAALGSSL